MKALVARRSFTRFFPLLSETVNKCDVGNSPPETGGVAAPSRKRCEATAAAQTGWSGLPECFRMRFLEKVPFLTTSSAPLKVASQRLLDVASTAPVSGGEWRAHFTHTFIDRRENRLKCVGDSPFYVLSSGKGKS